MADIQKIFSFPDGTRWVLERAPAETADGSVHFVVTVPPEVLSPPRHAHLGASDIYEVLEGSFEVNLDGRWRTLTAGERFEVPPGAVHTVANRSAAVARVRNVHRPAKRFDQFVAHADELTRARRITSLRDPRVPILFSLLMREYPDTLVPGRRRDRTATAFLAALGRLLGMDTQTAMPRAPGVIVNPRTGQRMRFLTRTPELLEFESWSAPHSPPELEHVHPKQLSDVRVVSGALRFEIAGVRRDVAAGESISIPAGTPHSFSNPFDGEARWIGTFRPALGIAAFFETYFALADEGRLDERGMPGLLQLAVMLPAFGDEIRPTRPPWPVLKALAAVLGPVARLRGYRPVAPAGATVEPKAVSG